MRSAFVALVLCLSMAPALAGGGGPLDDGRVHKVLGLVERHYWKRPVADDVLVGGALDGIMARLNAMERSQGATGGASSAAAVEPTQGTREYNQVLDGGRATIMRQELAGGFSGIGAVIRVAEASGAVLVERVLPGSPSEEAGVRDGDEIESVDGSAVRGRPLGEVVGLLRGARDSRVTLGLRRDEGPAVVVVVRGPVVVPAVDAGMLGEGVGWCRIRVFHRRTASALRGALADLAASGARRLVLDLRQNPGGALDAAVAAASAFLAPGTPVVTTRGADGTKVYRSEGTPAWPGTMVCLVDGGTASGAEILAGALAAEGRALLLGRPTFGKDSVQTVYELDGGWVLKLSTSCLEVRSAVDSRLLPHVELPEPPAAKEGFRLPDRPDQAAADPWVKAALAVARFGD